ncbi:hypothetical protein PoB_007601000 [Plakobranchus ocellatus]|uniref:Uncharacterized protein n=1 Tax=Plakobranchus ocellatus TaxID=259542 RepID=A0AAV4DZT3_9GAST|nr:hypothetical protein PoB_007601000 [Plakobranchus ocellatus]
MLNIKLKHNRDKKKKQVIDEVQYIQRYGGGQDILLEKKTIDGLKDAQSVATKVRKKRQGQTRSKMDGDIRRAAGPQWQRKAQDRRKWKTSTESYMLQWMDKAQSK